MVQVDAATLASSAGPRLRTALSEIPGVTDVRVREALGAASAAPGLAPVPPRRRPARWRAAPPATAVTQDEGGQVLPRSNLFEPLMADPRWPRFSAAYRYYTDDPDVDHAGAVSFGETFSLYRNSLFGGRWEVGFQAAVFSVFDMNSDSLDLINADYWVGIPLSYRIGDFSMLGRLYHQSSHLGDEFLLREGIDQSRRINVSYEAVEGLASYDIGEEFRVYGGFSYLFDQEPSDLKPWGTQAGLEYESSETFAGGRLRPDRGRRPEVQGRIRLGHGPVAPGRRPVGKHLPQSPAYPADGGILQRLQSERSVLLKEAGIHRLWRERPAGLTERQANAPSRKARCATSHSSGKRRVERVAQVADARRAAGAALEADDALDRGHMAEAPLPEEVLQVDQLLRQLVEVPVSRGVR